MAPQTGISAELAASPMAENAIALHPTTLMRYERQLERLQETLEAGVAAGDTEAAAAIRDLVESVVVNRDRYGGVEVEIHADLRALGQVLARTPFILLSMGSVVPRGGIELSSHLLNWLRFWNYCFPMYPSMNRALTAMPFPSAPPRQDLFARRRRASRCARASKLVANANWPEPMRMRNQAA
jgi:hypothetical protein